MLTINDRIPDFSMTVAKPGFNMPEENGESAFEIVNQDSFAGKWKVIYFYPMDFTFVCPTEIVGFAQLNQDFADRDCVVLGGSSDNAFVKLAWRREHKDLNRLQQYSFADANGEFAKALGVVDSKENVALRATFIVDPDNVIQHVSVNSLNVGRSPQEILRILDGLQTNELCPCNRPVSGETLGG